MENAAWYTWDDMTPWRFAILGGVVLVTLVVIKLVERYGCGKPEDWEEFSDRHAGRCRTSIGYTGNCFHDD